MGTLSASFFTLHRLPIRLLQVASVTVANCDVARCFSLNTRYIHYVRVACFLERARHVHREPEDMSRLLDVTEQVATASDPASKAVRASATIGSPVLGNAATSTRDAGKRCRRSERARVCPGQTMKPLQSSQTCLTLHQTHKNAVYPMSSPTVLENVFTGG